MPHRGLSRGTLLVGERPRIPSDSRRVECSEHGVTEVLVADGAPGISSAVISVLTEVFHDLVLELLVGDSDRKVEVEIGFAQVDVLVDVVKATMSCAVSAPSCGH